MSKTWITPGGPVPKLCLDILQQPHVLIAGATGSGKSVLINSTIYTALHSSPAQKRFILIDPKRVELSDYKHLPHTLGYASERNDIRRALQWTGNLMERRYQDMEERGLKRHDGADIYVVVDEFADLMTTDKNAVVPVLCRLAQLGRAAGIHLILATQRPTRDIVTGQIKVNIDARMALRCPTAQDSRNIIEVKGAETLPRYGLGYWVTPETMHPELWQIPMTDAAKIKELCSYWMQQA